MKNLYSTTLILNFRVEANSENVAKEATGKLIRELSSTYIYYVGSEPNKSYCLISIGGYIGKTEIIK